MDRKKTKGRQKIAIRRIERGSDFFASFSKRRLGLLRKASDLSTLCDLDVGIVIYSPTGKPFSFFHPTMESVIGRAQGPNNNKQQQRRVSSHRGFHSD
ncbi:agamous-like mads-box protein agl61 [Phtheirospermum japonicum]|uniref:Agamous-like mads-box protein agl61 n=1 Tax=Phtheirospermum japonicum TaxID=374723 RepID=A0A830CEW2_9LAMI|nr:agamous-like mads-box protein agl61 [Phtheirospermum japonicum]